MKTDLMQKTAINPMTGYYGEEKHNLRETVVSEEFGIEDLSGEGNELLKLAGGTHIIKKWN